MDKKEIFYRLKYHNISAANITKKGQTVMSALLFIVVWWSTITIQDSDFLSDSGFSGFHYLESATNSHETEQHDCNRIVR